MLGRTRTLWTKQKIGSISTNFFNMLFWWLTIWILEYFNYPCLEHCIENLHYHLSLHEKMKRVSILNFWRQTFEIILLEISNELHVILVIIGRTRLYLAHTLLCLVDPNTSVSYFRKFMKKTQPLPHFTSFLVTHTHNMLISKASH